MDNKQCNICHTSNIFKEIECEDIKTKESSIIYLCELCYFIELNE